MSKKGINENRKSNSLAVFTINLNNNNNIRYPFLVGYRLWRQAKSGSGRIPKMPSGTSVLSRDIHNIQRSFLHGSSSQSPTSPQSGEFSTSVLSHGICDDLIGPGWC